jgi:hypothetical protein
MAMHHAHRVSGTALQQPQTGASRVRTGFIAIELVGAALSLTGVACLAALPLPDYRWYNRLAVVVFLGVLTCLVGVVDLVAKQMSGRAPDPVAFALGSLALGVPFIGIFAITIRELPDYYPEVADTSRFAAGVKLMPIGIAVQLVPPVLGLAGVHLW